MILGDVPAFVRMSLICLVFSIHVMVISFLSTISLIADISTSNWFSGVCFIVCTALYTIIVVCTRSDVYAFAIMK